MNIRTGSSRIVRGRFVLALGLGISLSVITASQSPAQNRLQPLDNAPDPVVATVDGSPILRSEVTDFQRQLPPQYQKLPLQMLYPALLDKLIEIKLISEAGQKEKLADDEEVKRRIDLFRERVIEEVYLQRIIEKQVTDDTLKQRYDKYVKETPARQEISARHILVQTESEAKDVLTEIKKGADFAELARARSLDPSAKAQGGDLGFFTRDEMVPEFSNAAFKLKDGEVSLAPVKTQFGWHIIKVEAHRTTVPPFDQMREKLTFDMSNEIKNDIVAKLKKTAKVERFNLDGSQAK